MITALRFSDLLTEFLLRTRPLFMAEGDEDVPLDDPRRSPDWCHAHGCPLSQCSGQHG